VVIRGPRRRLALTTIGRADPAILDELAPILQDAFEARIFFTLPSIEIPKIAYNVLRQQYHSTELLNVLARQKSAQWERLLGITDVDLYTQDLNFVFGEADARRGVALFSSARLHSVDREQFVRRAATEAIHEIAHTYGLGHCNKATCVMWFSNTLEETDRKGTGFCQAHTNSLRRALERRR
jgi:archaemetzincin